MNAINILVYLLATFVKAYVFLKIYPNWVILDIMLLLLFSILAVSTS